MVASPNRPGLLQLLTKFRVIKLIRRANRSTCAKRSSFARVARDGVDWPPGRLSTRGMQRPGRDRTCESPRNSPEADLRSSWLMRFQPEAKQPLVAHRAGHCVGKN